MVIHFNHFKTMHVGFKKTLKTTDNFGFVYLKILKTNFI